MTGNTEFVGGLVRRWRLTFVIAVVFLAVVVASPALAGSLNRGQEKAREGVHPGCHGLANAYAHGAQVAEVAAAHGCDLTGITPVQHPAHADGDKPDADEGDGPPAEVVAAKCDRIAVQLDAAKAREHGNSAEAFTRQAEHWSCPN